MSPSDLAFELDRIRSLVKAWHDASGAESRFPPAPTRVEIDAAERLLGIPLPVELRRFCEEFRCDRLDQEYYLQYDPEAIAQLTRNARANDGWVFPVLRIDESDWVFYQDGAGNCATFQVTADGALRCVVEREHDSEDVRYERFSDWLDGHVTMLVAVLRLQKDRERKKPFWRFWTR